MVLAVLTKLSWSLTWLSHFYAREDSSSDERLIVAARHGDMEAFDKLVDRHAAQVHAVARRLVAEDLVADIVQDVFIAAYRQLHSFRGQARFTTWLYKITVNRCHRVNKRQRPTDTLPETLESRQQQPDLLVEQALTLEALEHALAKLPEKYRLALTLREFADLSYEEIARVLGVRQGTVKSRLARARSLLREELKAKGMKP